MVVNGGLGLWLEFEGWDSDLKAESVGMSNLGLKD